MSKIQFPQINRKLTAGIWLILFIIVLGTNLLQSRIFSLTQEKKLRQQLLQDPAISSLHEKLGQYYLGINEKAAEREYLIAQEYYLPQEILKSANVLGDQSPPAQAGSPWQTWNNLLAKKKSRENEQSYWEKITEAYPDYIYAYLKLAVLHFQKGEADKANTYLVKVLQTDPTNQTAINLQQKFQ